MKTTNKCFHKALAILAMASSIVCAESTQDEQGGALENQRFIVTQETALNFVETLPNGQLKWGECLEYPHGWGQEVNISKETGRIYFSTEFVCIEEGKKVLKRVYFDITEAMPFYRDALSSVCSQIAPRLKQLRQSLTSITDKESADRLAADIEPLLPLVRLYSEGIPAEIPSAICSHIMEEQGIISDIEAIYEEAIRLIMERYFGSERLDKVMRGFGR